MQWLRARGRECFAVPNGAVLAGASYNKYALLGRLTGEGLLRGAPDLVMVDRSPATGRPVAVEMKRCDGRLSPVQRTVLGRMEIAGWDVVVAFGAADGIGQLQALGF